MLLLRIQRLLSGLGLSLSFVPISVFLFQNCTHVPESNLARNTDPQVTTDEHRPSVFDNMREYNPKMMKK